MVLATTELQNFDFLVTTVAQNLGRHFRALNQRRANLEFGTISHHQHLIDIKGRAHIDGKALDAQVFTLLNAVLLTACHDHCIHDGVLQKIQTY